MSDIIILLTLPIFPFTVIMSLTYAVKHKIIPFNPADTVELPKKQLHRANYYDEECLQRVSFGYPITVVYSWPT